MEAYEPNQCLLMIDDLDFIIEYNNDTMQYSNRILQTLFTLLSHHHHNTLSVIITSRNISELVKEYFDMVHFIEKIENINV